MCDDPHRHELFAVIAAVLVSSVLLSSNKIIVLAAYHHERVGQALDKRTIRLAEALDGVTAGRVGDIDRSADLDVITVREV